MRARLVLAALIAFGLLGTALAVLLSRHDPAPALGAALAPGESGPRPPTAREPVDAPTSLTPQRSPEDETVDGRRMPAANASLAGRVVERGTHAPVAGVRVELSAFGDLLASATTDASGRFALPRPDRRGLSVWVRPPEGWKVERPRQRVREHPGEPAAPIVFELTRSRACPVRAVLVDRVSGEPVPDYRVRSTWEGGAEEVVSDEDGRIASKQALEPGPVTLLPLDFEGATPRPSDAIELEHAGGPDPIAVALDVGPTYFVEVRLPEGYGLADLRADLERSTSYPRFSSRNLEGEGRFRAGSPPWVRLRGLRDDLHDDATAANLRVWTADGAWGGSAQVRATRGVVSGPIRIELVRFGGLRVKVLGPDDAPVPDPFVDVRFRNPDLGFAGGMGDGEYGVFVWPMAVPGRCSVRVTNQRYEPLQREVDVVAGERTDLELRPVPLVVGGDVRGRLSTRSGDLRHRVGVELRGAREEARRFLADVEWGYVGARLEGTFEVRDLPADEYVVRVVDTHGFRWSPPSRTVAPPTRGLEFVCEDDLPAAWLVVDVVGDGSTEPELGFQVSYGVEVDDVAARMETTEAVVGMGRSWELGLYPLDVPLRWAVNAEGYVSVHGDASDFSDESSTPRGRVRTARVGLRRGWGGTLRVESEDRQALAGVRVLADGVELGTTGVEGELEIALEGPPGSLTLELEGWTIRPPEGTQGPRLPEPDRWGELHLVMQPSGR